jgi:hypothetical protein
MPEIFDSTAMIEQFVSRRQLMSGSFGDWVEGRAVKEKEIYE